MLMKHLLRKTMLAWSLFVLPCPLLADNVVTTQPATNVTQTRATLSAQFADGSTNNGFQFKYGTLPELNEISEFVLSPQSEPVLFTQNDKPWNIRSVRGYIESSSDKSKQLNSTIQTTVTLSAPTTLTFEWSVNSEENVGFLRFLLDGQETGNNITGNVAFTSVSYTVPAGTHTLAWSYQRSDAEYTGLGLGFLRNINIQNTTIGEWVDTLTTEPTLCLERLYPNKSYLFRAFSDTSDGRLYGKIHQLKTEDVSLGSPVLTDTMQASVGLSAPVVIGDADVETGFIVERKGVRQPDSDFAWHLLDKNSDAITITAEDGWNCGSGSNQGSGVNVYYVGTTYNNKSVTTSFYLTESSTISFNYYCKGGYIYFFVDGVRNASLYTSSNSSLIQSYSKTLSSGYHTLKWSVYKTSNSSSSYNAVLCYLKVTNTNNRYEVLETDSVIAVPANGFMEVRAKDLIPNSEYKVRSYMIPRYSGLLGGDWPQTDTESIDFTTRNVEAQALDVIDIRQASATLRGLAIGGDAKVAARGLQYRATSGTRWSNTTVTIKGDTLLANISNLKPSTEYSYRSFIQAEGADTIFSNTMIFYTEAIRALRPTVINKTQHTATISCESGAGDASAYIYTSGIQFRKQGDTEWDDTETNPDLPIVTLKKENLDVASFYEVRSYMQPAGSDIIYSDILTFQTKDIEAVADSVKAYQHNAVLYGRVMAGDDTVTERKVEVYQSSWYGTIGALVSTADITTSDEKFAVVIDRLQPSMYYTYIIKAKNSLGKEIKSKAYSSDGANYLLNTFSQGVKIAAEGWSMTRSSVFNGSYSSYVNNYSSSLNNSTLTAKLQVLDSVDANFSYCIKGYSYSGSTNIKYLYNSIHFAIDDEPIATFTGTSSNSGGIYTFKLAPGEHTLTWTVDSLAATCTVSVWNMAFAKSSAVNYNYTVGNLFTTSAYTNGVYDRTNSKISQTKAIISYKLNPTNNEQPIYKLRVYNDDSYASNLDPSEYPGNYHYYTGTVKDSVVTYQLDNLLAGVAYYMTPLAEIENDTIYSDNINDFFRTASFVAGDEKSWYGYAYNVRQTSAIVQVLLPQDVEAFTDPYFFIIDSEKADTLRLAAKTVVEEIDPDTVAAGFEREPYKYLQASVSGLMPGKRYGMAYELKANGITYHNRDYYYAWGQPYQGFTTLGVIASMREEKITQTTASFSITLDESEVKVDNLKLWIGDRELTYEKGIYSINELIPGDFYTVRVTYEVNGRAYNEERYSFYTKWVDFSYRIDSVYHTACQFHVEADLGTATLERRLVFINNMDTVKVDENWIVRNLKPDTTYLMQPIIALKGGKMVYGNYVSVTTKSIALATLKPSNISNRSATLNGVIECDDLSSAEFGFQWKEKTGWTTEPRFTKGHKMQGSDSISVALVNGMLKPDTEYEYRTAVRYQGQIFVAEEWKDLRTELEYVYYPATAYTLYRTDSENNRLVLCGYYIAGSESVESQGYEYWATSSASRTTRAANSAVQTILTDSTMTASIDLETLTDGNYNVRAFVKTASGTIYGQTLAFKVGKVPTDIQEDELTEPISPSVQARRGCITIINAEGHHALLTDLSGRMVWSGRCGASQEIHVAKGVYVVRLDNGSTFKLQVK